MVSTVTVRVVYSLAEERTINLGEIEGRFPGSAWKCVYHFCSSFVLVTCRTATPNAGGRGLSLCCCASEKLAQ